MRHIYSSEIEVTSAASTHPTLMRNAAWIWFAGFAAWLFAGLVGLRNHSYQHAQLDFLVAMVFFVAALFYRQQRRR